MNAFPASAVIIAFIVAIVLAAALGFLLGRSLTRSRYLERLTRAETTSRILSERTEDLEADAQMAGEITAAIGPLAASVKNLQENLHSQDRTQIEQITRLNSQIGHLSQQNLRLQESTGSLANALNSTTHRGDWGEVQLKRIVEYAGLLPTSTSTRRSAPTGTASATAPIWSSICPVAARSSLMRRHRCRHG